MKTLGLVVLSLALILLLLALHGSHKHLQGAAQRLDDNVIAIQLAQSDKFSEQTAAEARYRYALDDVWIAGSIIAIAGLALFIFGKIQASAVTRSRNLSDARLLRHQVTDAQLDV